jgi:flagellar M-ring protein FliF
MAFRENGELDLTGGTSSEQGDDMLLTVARTGGVLALVALVLFLAYRSARRSSLAKYPVAIPLPDPVDEANAVLMGLAEELERGQAAAELAPAEPPRQLVLQDQIGDLIDRQPEDVAAVLRTWLADRRA